MLIKRTEREKQRRSLATLAGDSNSRLDRRAFLRVSLAQERAKRRRQLLRGRR